MLEYFLESVSKIMIFNIVLNFMCLSILPAFTYVYVFCIYAVSEEAKRGHQSPWKFNYRGFMPLCGYWKLKWDAPQEQQIPFPLNHLSSSQSSIFDSGQNPLEIEYIMSKYLSQFGMYIDLQFTIHYSWGYLLQLCH